ncbi:molecular chaperone TorD family protein [Litorivicinus sp.]|jgi:TorA maturation chaperone TorD|nr:molecular chaperone TorD family protein [Litorivicinus sp.]MDB9862843.1 molecular chaperone TorD family protein [Litorivicinus sp.]MDC1208516.1 molecular chaperone TorD family protein [Litorivicinus sp.]MDC1239452.1 molecular chaperone TorD family protein [Litorivicinus sp.]MDC1319122.1 molecular chaperone TorD family protein [Litorivicinus sp.]
MIAESAAEFDSSVSPEDQARSDLYALLGSLLLGAPSESTLISLRKLKAGDGEIGSAISALAQVAKVLDQPTVEREFNQVFIGVSRGEVLPYASYYLTGFLHEKPLADLRAKMRFLGIQRISGVVEPEDHIGSLCEIMSGLASGSLVQSQSLDLQKEFFNAHIAPWAAHCFSDLEKTESAVLYAPVGSLGSAFMAIEQEAFRIE